MDILEKEYPIIIPALNFKTPFELLIASILSAQCTDERVNKITSTLFQKYRSIKSYTVIETEILESDIYSAGYYKQKAKNIKKCCELLLSNYNGIVPGDFNELVKLPGIGRKIASVVAGNAFGIPSIAVDTHVKRLANIMGFVNSKNPDKIEICLKELLPKSYWIKSSQLFASHGRAVCKARKPDCDNCILSELCPKLIS